MNSVEGGVSLRAGPVSIVAGKINIPAGIWSTAIKLKPVP
jgi:hypothetical protein